MAEIVHYMQKRQYQRANDSYLRLSIGNAPWPIGVTMVGYVDCVLPFDHPCNKPNSIHPVCSIHERSAREKISADQVAHVLNDEVSRKYIQSLKRCVGGATGDLSSRNAGRLIELVSRLLTFSQTKYPPEDISQLMG